MSATRTVMCEITPAEAANLTQLIGQFRTLLAGSADAVDRSDPAISRLVPSAYPDDPDAATQFRELTESDLLTRRDDDAARMLHTLRAIPEAAGRHARRPVSVPLAPGDVDAWMRTLAAVRLVLAARMDIRTDDDPARPDDPRYGVYEWLGYRLELLVQTVDAD